MPDNGRIVIFDWPIATLNINSHLFRLLSFILMSLPRFILRLIILTFFQKRKIAAISIKRNSIWPIIIIVLYFLSIIFEDQYQVRCNEFFTEVLLLRFFYDPDKFRKNFHCIPYNPVISGFKYRCFFICINCDYIF